MHVPIANTPSAPEAPVSLEIERKWIINSENLPDLSSYHAKEVIQGYVAVTVDGTEVRLRQKGEKYFQTIKTSGELVRGEFEIELSKSQFADLWSSTIGRRLEKLRYEIPYEGRKIELDLYKGSLQGLIVAEVEFKSESEASNFVQPSWFGREVTADKAYKNKNLAVMGVPKN